MASQEQSVEQLFAAALDHAPADRPAFLDRACARAPELRRSIEELLLADQRAGSFLEKPLLISGPGQSYDTGIADKLSEKLIELNPSGRFKPGQMIASRFMILRFIARGGMGEVYEVEDSFLQGVHVALKVILPEIAGDASSSHRFEQEVLLARKVTHPNLCPIYDISRCLEPHPPFLFLTMKFLPGETLASRLGRLPQIPREEAISIFQQMVAGLTALHDAGVIHRDIKPSNVMLDHTNSQLCLSIMDFGLARLYDSQTTVLTRGLIAGTPGYIAPELLRGECPSQATDIFALGVLFQEVSTGEHPKAQERGLSAKPSTALDTADIPPVFIRSIKEFLSEDPKRRCKAFKDIRSTLDFERSLSDPNDVALSRKTSSRILTRRNFVVGSTLTACAATVGTVWKWDSVSKRIEDLLHPLPAKRFVALLNWPPSSDVRIKPMLFGVIDAIAAELSRAEAFDRNLFVTAENTITEIKTSAQLSELRDSLGANLVLAASAIPKNDELHLSLSVLDSTGTNILREKLVRVPLARQSSLPDKAVRAAAELLDVSRYKPDEHRMKAGTDNPEALAAFQSAEVIFKQPNDTGLDAAIAKYKQAIEIDPRYAKALAGLSWAYIRLYGMHGDPAAINLARENSESAILLDPTLVDAHLGLAWVEHQIGSRERANREMSKALSLDPSNPVTLLYQAKFYAAAERWKEAEETYNRLLRLRPNYWLVHNEFGMILYSQGNYQLALTEFRSASLIAPNNALAFANIGEIYLALGRLSEAVLNFTQSYQLNVNDLAAVGLAEANRILGNYPEAISKAKEAVALSPSVAEDWVELGDCCSTVLTMQKEAASAYKQAKNVQEEQLQIEPKNGPAWMLLALCHAKTNDFNSSEALIARAEKLGAGDLDSQKLKVRVLTLLDRNEQAIDVLAQCIEKGATSFQFQTMPDLEPLRRDPRYRIYVMGRDSVTESES